MRNDQKAVELVKVERKGYISGQFKTAFESDIWNALGEALGEDQGGVIQIIPSNINSFNGEREEITPDPDQPELPMEEESEPESHSEPENDNFLDD